MRRPFFMAGVENQYQAKYHPAHWRRGFTAELFLPNGSFAVYSPDMTFLDQHGSDSVFAWLFSSLMRIMRAVNWPLPAAK